MRSEIATATMRAGVLVAPGLIEVQELPVPHPPPGGVVVRVRAALTDGTDLKAFRRGHPKMPMPTRFGHEFSGDIVAVGEGEASFEVGDAVVSVHSAPCGSCFWCAHHQEELCEHVMETMILGAYAQYLAVPQHIVERNMFGKPESLSYEAAAFLEPLACVVHSLRILNPPKEGALVIIGSGGFGLLHALVARAMNVTQVIVVGRSQQRLGLARDLGLNCVVDAPEGAALVYVREQTEGHGADAVVECTGSAAVWEQAESYLRRGGTLSLFGGLPVGSRVSFDAARLHYDEVRIVSPFHFTPAAVCKAFDLLASHAVDPLPLITRRFPLEQLPDAFKALDAGDGVKYVIVP